MATNASTAFDLEPPTEQQLDNLVAGLTDEERHQGAEDLLAAIRRYVK